ncbi:MAG: DUF4124 domain-containing protein [Gammaproteobacteria bacterium]|nr:DUF4124 domain-containing protein [Gammaproteobacteria bacterium]MBU1645782.1 DUF4124 domain-containing protein [Gammaproteobacteria bacterium]MBU1971290.1 DUF4124 domain-containing protein [Gammaproteobacteria bacterium]
MRTPALISVVAMFALPLVASAQIYTWKDASGKTIYSDKPPLEKKVQTRELHSGKLSGGEPVVPAAKERTGEDTATEAGAANGAASGKSPEQIKAENDARQQLCDNARKRLIQLESTQGVLVTKNEQGLDVPLVGDARRAETENARKDVANWCK